ncbi:MAG: restriction endonuclease subunit S [Gammaproteobacteria bacterium]
MLPEGWTRSTLGECSKLISGNTPSKERQDYWSGEFPWVTVKDMKSFWVRRTGLTLTEAGKAAASVAPENSILVVTRGMALLKDLPISLAMRDVAFNQDIKAIVPTHGLDARFLAYQLQSKKHVVLDMVDTAGHGTGKLDTDLLKSVDLVLPTIQEQRRIAQILGTWDQAIATTERLLSSSRKQWNALLGITLNLPCANPDASTPTDNGGFPASVQPGIPTLPAAPAGWRRIQLRDHLKEVRRPVALKEDESYTLVTVKRSRGGVALREVLRGNEVKTPTQFHVRTGDFLISKRQIVHGACGIVPPELDGAVVSNEYSVLNTDGEIDLKFLRYLSETRYFQQTCFHSSIGVHVEKMIFKTDHWLSWPFNIPPLDQQRRIVEIMDTASREIAAIAEQLKVLKREKSALMSQLLTGKRRVKLPEPDTEPHA